MSNAAVGLFILASYMALMLWIGLRSASAGQSNIRDYAVASSSFGIFVLTLTFCATYHSAYAFLGTTGFIYKNGIGWWVNGIWTVLPGVIFWVWGRRVWYLGQKYGYLSMGDLVTGVYGSKWLGLLVTLVGIVFTIPYIAMQAIGSGYIFQSISSGILSYEVGTFIFFTIMVLYVWMGGLRAVAWTDAAQGVWMFVMILIGGYLIALKGFGGFTPLFEQAARSAPDLFTMPGPAKAVTVADWVSRWIGILLGVMMLPQTTVRFFAGRSLRVMKWSAVMSSAYLTFLFLFTPAVGFAARLLYPDHKTPDILFPVMLLRFTPMVFASLVIAGALAASMSTGDSQLHAASILLANDVYKRHLNPKAGDARVYSVARAMVIVLGIISVAMALKRPGLLGDILAIATSGATVLVPTVVGALYWPRSTVAGALSSIILGEAAVIYTTFYNKNPFGLLPGFWGTAVSLVVFIVVSLLTKSSRATEQIVTDLNRYFAD